MMNLYDVNTVKLKQCEEEPERVKMYAYYTESYEVRSIGYFDFFDGYGYVRLPDGTELEYKRWKPLLNNFFKLDEFFGWEYKEVEKAMLEGKRLNKEYKES